MKKIVVYWSGTGNTLEIANKIAGDLGCDAFSVSDTTPEDVLANDLIIFGCPAMGAEELEDSEFRPFYDAVMANIGDKKVALFGSYGWGDGEWMRNWEAEVAGNLVAPGLIVNGGESDIDSSAYDSFISSLK
jgi:flavodoxin short chain